MTKRLEPLTALLSKAPLVLLVGIGLLEVTNTIAADISVLIVVEP